MLVKVTLVHNTIAPYRHPLFERLSKSVDLMVYYCSAKESGRKWDLWPRNYDYKWKILPRIPIRNPIGELSFNPTIVKELIKNRPHTIIIGGYVDPTMWLAFAIGKILKIPVIYWTEGMREPQLTLGIITRPFRTLFVKKSDAVVVPGRASKRYVVSLGVNMEKVFIASNTIDNELFIAISDRYKPWKDKFKGQIGFKGKVVILYVGQLIKRKGIEFLLHAYGKLEQEHDDIALLLVGSGPLEQYLKSLANSLQLKNFKIIHSGLSLKELIKIYLISDIFILPTLEDIWGFVINEAMACRLPVVATRASQAALEMVRHGENGYIVKEADSEELYDALKRLITAQELREKMGERSREIVGCEFDVLHMIQGFLSAIKHCINSVRK